MFLRGEAAPSGLTHIFGLFLEGASWNLDGSSLQEAKPRVLYETMPLISLKITRTVLTTEEAEEKRSYVCPVYQTQ